MDVHGSQTERCRLCPTGHYRAEGSEGGCDPVTGGYVTVGHYGEWGQGGVSQARCGHGHWAEDGRDCRRCAAGESTPVWPALLQSDCRACAAGSHEANRKCVKCGVGTYQREVGQTLCSGCPNGTYTSEDRTFCSTSPSAPPPPAPPPPSASPPPTASPPPGRPSTPGSEVVGGGRSVIAGTGLLVLVAGLCVVALSSLVIPKGGGVRDTAAV